MAASAALSSGPAHHVHACMHSTCVWVCATALHRDSGVKAIEKLMEKRGRFDYILLETTGLADPGRFVQGSPAPYTPPVVPRSRLSVCHTVQVPSSPCFGWTVVCAVTST